MKISRSLWIKTGEGELSSKIRLNRYWVDGGHRKRGNGRNGRKGPRQELAGKAKAKGKRRQAQRFPRQAVSLAANDEESKKGKGSPEMRGQSGGKEVKV